MDVLLEGFRNKDPGLIASLLHEDVVTEITHAGVEYGRKETIKNSLRDWLETCQAKGDIFPYYYRLWGKNVVVEIEQRHDGLCLNNIHSFEDEEDRIVRWKFYCFSWELLNLAAEELGLKLNAENFQHIF
ncbi:hypothetical protein [Peribacillus kribbensis]|uniref:hypothetical protein n=1 Tax=Peribacillus kribbensis TaxID=356658 RepID=UPI00040053C6|nr:hypothetical protein [Peribacillus kribbensis]